MVHSGDDPRPRMPRILFRHITADLLRIKLLTGFLLLAVLWLAFTGLGLGSADAAADGAAQDAATAQP